jgi:hypothetical protein
MDKDINMLIKSDTSLQTLLRVSFIAERPGSGWMESPMDRCAFFDDI